MSENFILIPGRTSRQGCGISEGKFRANYQEETHILQVAPEDMRRLGLRERRRVRITSEFGAIEVAVTAAKGDEVAAGLAVHRLWRPLQSIDGRRHARIRDADQQGIGRVLGTARRLTSFMPADSQLRPRAQLVRQTIHLYPSTSRSWPKPPVRPPDASSPLKIVEDATCTFCGCVCDDIELHVDGHKIVKAKRACVLGTAWFLNHEIEDIAVLPDRRPAGVGRGGHRTSRSDLWPRPGIRLIYGLSDTTMRIAARGGRHRRLDRRQRRHDDQRLPRSVGHGVSGRGRSDLLAGRSPQPRRPDHLLGIEPGRKPSAALHQVQPDAQGDVRAQRSQGPHLRRGRRAQDEVRQGRRHLPRRSSRGGTSRHCGPCGRWPRAWNWIPRWCSARPASRWRSGRT